MNLTDAEVNTSIIKAVERTCGTFINAIHDEAKGYCVRTIQGEWKVFPFAFINEIADLGYVNRCLLCY